MRRSGQLCLFRRHFFCPPSPPPTNIVIGTQPREVLRDSGILAKPTVRGINIELSRVITKPQQV